MLVVLLDLPAGVHAERSVGGVHHANVVHRGDSGHHLRRVLEPAGVDGDVAHRVPRLECEQLDGRDRPARLADRARHPAEHAGAVLDLNPDRDRVLRAGDGGRHFQAHYTCPGALLPGFVNGRGRSCGWPSRPVRPLSEP